MTYQVEIQRSNTTLTAFLASVKYTCKQKGIFCAIDREEFEKPSQPCNTRYSIVDGEMIEYFDGKKVDWLEKEERVRRASEAPCKSEICCIQAYNYQSYMLNFDGSMFNEICEFTWDDDKTGHGYYFQANRDAAARPISAEVEEKVAAACKHETDLHAMLEIAKNQLIALGYTEVADNTYTVQFSNKLSHALGNIRRIGHKQFLIKINTTFARTNDKGAQNTMMHEVIHSIEGCMNHGEKWKLIAQYVNNGYGYNVSRTSDAGLAYTVSKREQRNLIYIPKCRDYRKERMVANTNKPQE